MIYILEGVDCSGKSTCFEQLQRMYANKVIGYGNRREVVFIKESKVDGEAAADPERLAVEMEKRLQRMVDATVDVAKDYVFDRCSVIDDFVYSPVVDRQPSVMAMLPDSKWKVDAVLKRSVVFHFTASAEVLEQRMQVRGDDNVNVQALGAIEAEYRRFYSTHGVNPIVVDTSQASPVEIAHHVGRAVFRKEFKFAHITPLADVEHIRDINNHGYQMCLANQVAKGNVEYTEAYVELARQGAYVLMDNGAAEGEQLGLDGLWAAYHEIQPTEIILRDVLFDGKQTIAKHYEQVDYITAKLQAGEELPFKYIMAVPQGHDFEEWSACAEEIIRTMPVNTIGVSKFVTEWNGGTPLARSQCLKQLQLLMVQYGRPDLEVHLLGCTEPPDIIAGYQGAFPSVRGIDSVVAYNCAAALADPADGRPKRSVDLNGGAQAGPEAIANKQECWERLCGIEDNGLTGLWKQVM